MLTKLKIALVAVIATLPAWAPVAALAAATPTGHGYWL